MAIEVVDLSKTTFRTTRAADDICSDLTAKLGWDYRYVAARLAIARSLSLPTPPPPLTTVESEDMATAVRGMQLFGEGIDSAAWLSLMVQRCGDRALPKRAFQALVSAHWKRGAELLKQDWEHAGHDMAGFVSRLAELANFPGESESGPDEPTQSAATVVTYVFRSAKQDRTAEPERTLSSRSTAPEAAPTWR